MILPSSIKSMDIIEKLISIIFSSITQVCFCIKLNLSLFPSCPNITLSLLTIKPTFSSVQEGEKPPVNFIEIVDLHRERNNDRVAKGNSTLK